MYYNSPDRTIRDLERQVLVDPSPINIARLYHAKLRVGLPVCLSCENPYVSAQCQYQPVSWDDPSDRTQSCGRNLCDDCINNCAGCGRLLCQEHLLLCVECSTGSCLPDEDPEPGYLQTRVECWPAGGPATCDDCEFAVCGSCVNVCVEGCEGTFCPSCMSEHDCFQ